MFLPKYIYEYLPEIYTYAGIGIMLSTTSIIMVGSGLVLSTVGFYVWQLRKNARFIKAITNKKDYP